MPSLAVAAEGHLPLEPPFLYYRATNWVLTRISAPLASQVRGPRGIFTRFLRGSLELPRAQGNIIAAYGRTADISVRWAIWVLASGFFLKIGGEGLCCCGRFGVLLSGGPGFDVYLGIYYQGQHGSRCAGFSIKEEPLGFSDCRYLTYSQDCQL